MEHFTDDELAFLRQARFGELPERVKPDEYVELQEADPKAELSVPQTMSQVYYKGQPTN